MKKSIIIGMLVIALAFACSESNVFNPVSENQDVIALVVPNDNSEKLLLLADGRVINPVSGIANFNDSKFGTKFQLSFDPLTTSNGITEVNVLHYVKNPLIDFELQQKNSQESQTLSGTFSGDFYYIPVDSNAQTVIGPVSLLFVGNTYNCSSNEIYPVGGVGTYEFTKNEIVFADTVQWPSGTNLDLVLDNNFSYYKTDDQLRFFTERNEVYYMYDLRK